MKLRDNAGPALARQVRVLSRFCLLCALLFVAGCRTRQATVDVLSRDAGVLFQQAFASGVQAGLHANALRLQWEVAPANGDVQDQLRHLSGAVAAGDGIILIPQETLAMRSLVLDAVQHHLPVVVVDDDFGPPAGPLLSFVSNDESWGARLAAQRLAQKLHRHGTLAIVGIDPRLESSVTREVDFEHWMQVLAPNVRITLRQWGDAALTHQQQVCRDILSGPSPPDAIVALSSVATRGAFYARLMDPQKAKTLIVGFDQDDPGMLTPLATGDVDAVVMQNSGVIGKQAAANLLAEQEGRTAPARSFVQPRSRPKL